MFVVVVYLCLGWICCCWGCWVVVCWVVVLMVGFGGCCWCLGMLLLVGLVGYVCVDVDDLCAFVIVVITRC